MQTIQRLVAALLISVQASVWAMPDNPHTPQSDSSGTVVATENAGKYTYVQIDIEGEKVWYAVPANTFTPGEAVVAPSGGLPMKDFYSKSLDRTFETVYFVGAIKRAGAVEEAEALPPGHPPINAETSSETAVASFDFTGIEKPEGGKTVAEIYQASADLSGKKVVVRGNVMKVSNNILGKNWIHLQDGTGDALSNDLTITTKAVAEVGATVTVSGILATDRDFGSGYKYDVLLEDAEILAE